MKKKRDYDKWTRTEEECFFEALKSQGNNFVKISKRVESKNYNQVRDDLTITR